LGIYTLPLKNLRRNKLRNLSVVLRIAFGVLILLILVSSGLGINSIVEKSGTSNGKILENSNQTNNTSNETNVVTKAMGYLNTAFGSNFSENQLVIRVEGFLVNLVYILDGLASIALLMGVLGIMNTMGFNLSERRREIGILKSIGFTKKQILMSCTLEAGLLGLIGSLIGVIFGVLAIWFISTFFAHGFLTTLLPIWLIPGAIIISTLISLGLGLYPAWFASELKVEEALLCEY
jgi:putative ABC transport system permease protein